MNETETPVDRPGPINPFFLAKGSRPPITQTQAETDAAVEQGRQDDVELQRQIDEGPAPSLMESHGTTDETPITDGAPAVNHRAACDECDVTVLYRTSASGHGFIILERTGCAIDATIGSTPEGWPICPNGHGALTLVDDEIAREGGDDEPRQASLPGIVPVFNYQGAYLDLERQAVEVDQLHREYKDAAESAREAKKRWDTAAERYTKSALELRRRRREKVEQGSAIADVDPGRCAWEQANPEGKCPVCQGVIDTTPEHVARVDEFILERFVREVIDALHAVAMSVSPETVRQWTFDEKVEVFAWTKATIEGVDPLPARPAVLGTMHVAGKVNDDGEQACTQCDTNLIGPEGAYEAGMLVGTDCPGKAPEAGHHYPRRSRSKKKAAKE